MWIEKYSKNYPGLNKEAVWKVWSDVNNWPEWDEDLEWAELEEPFAPKCRYKLKPKKGRVQKISLTSFTDGHSFTERRKLIGGQIFTIHDLEETSSGLTIINKIIVTGWLKFLWIRLIANKAASRAYEKTEALVERAKNVG